MSVEDPFFVVRGEIEKSVNNCHELQSQWWEMLNENSTVKPDNYACICNDLRNGIRSIEWDLEDLEETINIVESNPSKFPVDRNQLEKRKLFIGNTSHCVQRMKDEFNHLQNKMKADKLLRKARVHIGVKNDYKNVANEYSTFNVENETAAFIKSDQLQQMLMPEQRNNQINLTADNVGMLNNMSKTIGNELDNQAILLDELGIKIENTQFKMDSIMKKMARVTPFSTEKKQWCAIGVLGSSMFIIFFLLVL